ncbi:hypothetical protein VTI28DRAFT_5176 [Corynascus sepedonium]
MRTGSEDMLISLLGLDTELIYNDSYPTVTLRQRGRLKMKMPNSGASTTSSVLTRPAGFLTSLLGRALKMERWSSKGDESGKVPLAEAKMLRRAGSP